MAFEGLLISGSLIKVISYTLLYSRVASLPEQQRPMESHWDPFGPISIPFHIWTVLSRLLNLLNSFYLLMVISKSITVHPRHFNNDCSTRTCEWMASYKKTYTVYINSSVIFQTNKISEYSKQNPETKLHEKRIQLSFEVSRQLHF